MREPFRVTPKMYSSNPYTAACAYIDAGMSVLVTHGMNQHAKCTCGEEDCGSPGKHPISEFFPKGVHSATRSKAKMKRALNKFPDANIAASLAGLTIVDTDGSEGEGQIQTLNLPETACVKTKRGSHRYYMGELPGGSIKASQLDILTGATRYAMLPPSVHETGFEYRWVKKSPKHAHLLPGELENLRRVATRKTVEFPNRKVAKGARNDTLFRTACALRRHIDNEATILAAVKIINERDCTEPLSDPELRVLVNSSGRYNDEALFGPPEQREPLPMEFLWYPYIPRHAVTIFAGDPGRGKSLLVAMLVAIVTGAGKWPMSSEVPTGNRVLLLSAEDNWARVTLTRLLKAGANIDNIRVMHKFRSLTDERLQELAKYTREWRPDLIVVDTLSAYMGGRDMHRQNEVGEFLAFLNEIAEASGCAIVALAHLNKQTAEHPMFRIVGSIGFAASIRSACFLGTDPCDRTRLALAHGKANGSEKGETIVFEKIGGSRDSPPILRAVGTSDATEVEVCKVERGTVGRPVSEADEARQFILEFLDSDEPKEWSKVQRAAGARSIASPATLNLVRAEMAKAGDIVKVGKARNIRWALPQSDEDHE
ncbi:AAA family ATPase [Mesorhizobium sp.]|uniref:AAA family ATPase n=1 Tax=Mesorhizobium sp. TaxID=1871066 RepID=UPI001225E647|nr:AAA family ATPase [Mesorhizobium sp.]TIL31700.1 MAG: hypothetical protein E5Y82_29910 [Mesorhizobium sp.]